MSPDTIALGEVSAEVLESSRLFLLAIANAELPAALRAKGGASDLVQEALTAAHQSLHQFRGSTTAELWAWLRAILLREMAMFRRRYLDTDARDVNREIPIHTARPEDGAATPVAELIRREKTSRLAEAINRLPGDMRTVVVLRSELGLSFAAIGERLDRNEEAARKIFERAMYQLRVMVDDPRD